MKYKRNWIQAKNWILYQTNTGCFAKIYLMYSTYQMSRGKSIAWIQIGSCRSCKRMVVWAHGSIATSQRCYTTRVSRWCIVNKYQKTVAKRRVSSQNWVEPNRLCERLTSQLKGLSPVEKKASGSRCEPLSKNKNWIKLSLAVWRVIKL